MSAGVAAGGDAAVIGEAGAVVGLGACGACGVAGESLQAVSSARRIAANSAAGVNDLIAVFMGSGSSFQRCSGAAGTCYQTSFQEKAISL